MTRIELDPFRAAAPCLLPTTTGGIFRFREPKRVAAHTSSHSYHPQPDLSNSAGALTQPRSRADALLRPLLPQPRRRLPFDPPQWRAPPAVLLPPPPLSSRSQPDKGHRPSAPLRRERTTSPRGLLSAGERLGGAWEGVRVGSRRGEEGWESSRAQGTEGGGSRQCFVMSCWRFKRADCLRVSGRV